MTETMTAAEYRAEMAAPKSEKASLAITRLFLSHIRARGLPVPRSKLHPEGELRFAATEQVVRYKPGKTKRAPQWRFDFAWPEHRIAVEYQGLNVYKGPDGKMHTSGGHADVQHFRAECEKRAWATVLGWRVLEFERDMIRKGYAIDMLVRLFAATVGTAQVRMSTKIYICDCDPTIGKVCHVHVQPALVLTSQRFARGITDELNFGGTEPPPF